MGADHSHGHTTGIGSGERNRKRLVFTLGLVLLYMVAEIVGGILTNSLALLADAGHMFSDAAALGLALFALWFARRPSPTAHTYGYYRTEILAALANGAALVAIALFIFYEAARRFAAPPDVDGPLMMAVAAGGLVVNGASLLILRGGTEESLNIRGAWLHVLMDTLGSVQAVIAGALIWTLDWDWADPAASILIGAFVVYSSWGLLREAVAVLMESAPGHIDVDEVRDAIIEVADVVEVHDLHIWTITSGLESLSAHVVVSDGRPRRMLLRTIRRMLRDRFGIDHMTIQLEPEGFEEHGIIL